MVLRIFSERKKIISRAISSSEASFCEFMDLWKSDDMHGTFGKVYKKVCFYCEIIVDYPDD